jgi:hypothetical protein
VHKNPPVSQRGILTSGEDQGQILATGVPFAPGTEIEIAISPKMQSAEEVISSDDGAVAAARERMRELFSTIKGFRNSPASRARNCMIADVFVDTNVVLDTIDEDPGAAAKRESGRSGQFGRRVVSRPGEESTKY